MHGHQTLDHFFEVFPLLLRSVIVAISIDFGWEPAESDDRVRLNSLDGDLLIRHRVFEKDDAVVETWLLLHNYVGGQRRLCQLLLGLIKVLLILSFLLH